MESNEMERRGRNPTAAGILILDKPTGVTSRNLVDQVVRLVPHTKVGHAGTLDPLATGILIVCVGPATRLVQNIQDLSKGYRTRIRLGARSDTLDADGRIEIEASPKIPSSDEIKEVIRPLVGMVIQIPPDFSAKKIHGKRAYDLARAGRTIDLAPQPVRIDRIIMTNYVWPHLELEIDCGGGTYIRSIARDIGNALGCGGLVETLVRTRTGSFTLEEAVDPATLSAETIHRHLRPALDAVPNLPRLALDAGQVEAIVQGKRLPARELLGDTSDISGQVVLLDSDGNLIALAEVDPELGWIQPRKVLI